jgi:GR25 family glycosyltransferase involved in LPS biosynthesis
MKAVLINREDRPERLKESRKELNGYGIFFDIFPAVISSPGWKGCRDSHLAVLEKYKDDKFVMVFEDDVMFLNDPMHPIAEVAQELHPAWDMLYLGISPTQKYLKVSPHLYKCNGGYTTHAIIWRYRQGGAVEYILNHKKDILKWDVFLSSVIHKKFNCFVIYPILCTQRQVQSDTCKRSDAGSIVRNYNKYCV